MVTPGSETPRWQQLKRYSPGFKTGLHKTKILVMSCQLFIYRLRLSYKAGLRGLSNKMVYNLLQHAKQVGKSHSLYACFLMLVMCNFTANFLGYDCH